MGGGQGQPGRANSPESTRRKVRRAADELGYHHNALARGLARGCSDIIGFISDGVATSPFAGQVVRRRAGRSLAQWENSAGGGYRRQRRRGTQNLLVHVRTPGRGHHLLGIGYTVQSLRRTSLAECQSVLVNCYDECGRFPAVVPDEVQGGATATRLLFGSRTPAYRIRQRCRAVTRFGWPSCGIQGRACAVRRRFRPFAGAVRDRRVRKAVTERQHRCWRRVRPECSVITTAPRSGLYDALRGDRGNACRTISPWSVSTTRK